MMIMMRQRVFFILIGCLFVFSGTHAEELTNLIKNGDFESSATGSSIVATSDAGGSLNDTWKLIVKLASTGTGVVVDGTDVYDGLKSLKVDLTNIDARYRFFLAQEIANPALIKYKLALYLKANKADIPFRIDFVEVTSGATDGGASISEHLFSTTTDWAKYECELNLSDKTTPPEFLRLVIRFNCLKLGNAGVKNEPVTYWLDDISLTGKVPEVVPVFEPLPYLQTKTQESILVNWYSSTGETGVPTVEYGLSSDALNQSAQGQMKAIDTKRWSEVKLTGLLPDTEYFYRCRIDDNVSKVYCFRTLPADNATGRKIRFVTFGDTHEASTTKNVAEAALAKLKSLYGEDIHNHVDFIAHTGDIVTAYGEKIDEFENVHFTPRRNLTYYLPVLISAGNHDFEKNDAQKSYFYDFMNFEDLSDATGTAKGKYFTQRIVNSLFIYLNTNNQYLCDESSANTTYQQQTAAQLLWLKEKLEVADADAGIEHVFVFGHHMPYSEIAPDWNLEKISDRLFSVMKNSDKLRMYQCGHIHSFERGMIEKNDGKGSFVMNVNGNSGSYPDYFGRYERTENSPFIHRSFEYTGFTITEVDPANGSYETRYYAYGQRRVVEGETSTRFIRSYSPVQEMDSWSYRIGQQAPAKPSLEVSLSDDTLHVQGSEYTGSTYDLMSVQYQLLESGTSTVLKDTVVHWEDYFGTSGFLATDGVMDLSRAYLHTDLNAGKNISEAFFSAAGEGSYQVRIRYRDRNYTWSEWSDPVSPGSSSLSLPFGGNNVNIYPVPVVDILHVEGVMEGTPYTLIATDGKLVRQDILDDNIQLGAMDAGVYFLSFEGYGQPFRIIKK